jgi:hypothetical protein
VQFIFRHLRQEQVAEGDERGELNFPDTKDLPGTNIEASHFFVGDGAFGLSTHMMRPFPGADLSKQQRIYNYR